MVHFQGPAYLLSQTGTRKCGSGPEIFVNACGVNDIYFKTLGKVAI